MRDSLRARRPLPCGTNAFGAYPPDAWEAHELHRLFFSLFQGGSAGVGLLLLRAAVGATAFAHGALQLAARDEQTLGTLAVNLLAVASGASLLAGFLTPVAGTLIVLGGIGAALSWTNATVLSRPDAGLSIILLVIMAAAVVLLGPGAYSIDARLFGRREIIIPDCPRPPRP